MRLSTRDASVVGDSDGHGVGRASDGHTAGPVVPDVPADDALRHVEKHYVAERRQSRPVLRLTLVDGLPDVVLDRHVREAGLDRALTDQTDRRTAGSVRERTLRW